MYHQSESQANLTPSGGILAFGLALPRSQPAEGYRALLALLPFLALGTSASIFNQGAVPGRHNLSTMPWPEPRWWEGTAPAQPGEVHIQKPDAGQAVRTPARPLPPAAAPAAGDRPEILAALTPALGWSRPGPGKTTLSRPAGPAGAFQPLFGQAPVGLGLSQSAGVQPEAGAGQHSTPWRPAGTVPAGIVKATSPRSQTRLAPPAAASSPANRHSGAAPIQAAATPIRDHRFAAAGSSGDLPAGVGAGPLAGRGWSILSVLTPGAPAKPARAEGGAEPLPLPARLAGGPAAFAGSEMSLAPDRSGFWPGAGGPGPALARPPAYPLADLPWPRPEPAVTGSPPTAESIALGWTGPAPRRYPEEPGPYAAAGGRGLVMAADTIQAIERLVVRQVQTQVAWQAKTIKTEVADRLAAERRLAVTELVSDEVVQALLQKMRALTREERFRLGRLR